ncbi:MAG TPA: carbohydrate kinase [Treponema sp.]|nr:carbohydrate kinase [Treponema sp.]
MEKADATLLLAYDLGTTGLKTCLYRFIRRPPAEGGDELGLAGSASARYALSLGPRGEAEQDVEDWWRAMAATTREVLALTGADPRAIAGISFCAQMQALVLVGEDGRALRPAMTYMDSRSEAEKRDFGGKGPRIAGLGLGLLLPSLLIAGGAAASAKDPPWKYRWVERNEPEVFARTSRWLDAKEALIARATGRFVMSRDSAFATFLMDSRPGKFRWSPLLARLHGVRLEHLPEIVESTEKVGGLTAAAAAELGLEPGTAVFAGGGDASLIGVGAGATEPGASHVYIGTSGWVSTVTNRRVVDTDRMIASVVGARPGFYNYFAEQETSGKCLEWVRDHLALDEVGVYLSTVERRFGGDGEWRSLVDFLCAAIADEEPGAGGLVFAPWLRGSRCPDEDPDARGIFIGIGLDTGKRRLIRAVVEGIALNKRILIDACEKKVPVARTLRFAGGGALSDPLCRILADATGRTVEAVEEPQNAGAAGAALVAAVGLGLAADLGAASRAVRVRKSFAPESANAAAYERNYRVLSRLYAANRRFFAELRG